MYPDTLERFHSRYAIDENGCWVWHGGDVYGFNTRGQPQISVRGREPRNALAYVASYEHYIGPVPEGYEVDHLCFNSKCVNPEHLEAVTPKKNKERAYKKYHERTHCKYGHELVGHNAYDRPDGRVACRTCRNEAARRWHEKNKATVGA